ncbi:MAG: ECF transporter S component [Ardenticatenaceae bacterium]|nr:ECF transporter S component [Ardenticatenaceae bacterium]HBY94915.1 hypothetical protein [Chloroflexota bacterium]
MISSRWVGASTSQAIVKLLGALVVATVVLFLASLTTSGDKATASGWLLYVIGGAAVVGIYYYFADKPIWMVGTREVVMMAVGAVLYGIFAWATNVIQLPSVSFVSLRPAVAIPIFFGLAFGPVVGFFTGAVGNILGDAITGWGVYPVWDLGNGLMGLIPGLIWAFSDRQRAADRLLVVVGGLLALFTILSFAFPTVEHPWNGTTVGQWAPVLLILLIAVVVVARFLLRARPNLSAAVVWGAFGVIIGMGFASIADIWVNGYNVPTALLGEFLPAAGTNLIFAIILVPILLAAWQAARAQTGR